MFETKNVKGFMGRKKDFFFSKQIEKLVNITRTKWDSPESEGMQVGNCRFLIKRNRELMHRKKQSVCIILNRVGKKPSTERDPTTSPEVIHRMNANKSDTAH